MSSQPLRPAVRPLLRKSNRWWYKLTAVSFTVKVLVLVAIFFGIKYAADNARQSDSEPASESR